MSNYSHVLRWFRTSAYEFAGLGVQHNSVHNIHEASIPQKSCIIHELVIDCHHVDWYLRILYTSFSNLLDVSRYVLLMISGKEWTVISYLTNPKPVPKVQFIYHTYFHWMWSSLTAHHCPSRFAKLNLSSSFKVWCFGGIKFWWIAIWICYVFISIFIYSDKKWKGWSESCLSAGVPCPRGNAMLADITCTCRNVKVMKLRTCIGWLSYHIAAERETETWALEHQQSLGRGGESL